jgi:HEAT repeat protein
VIKGLISALKDDDKDVRLNAARVLGRIGKKAEPAINVLISTLKDDRKDVRSSAAYALGEIGTKSEPVIKGLISTLKDDDKDVRLNATYALVQIGIKSEPVIKRLIGALKDDDKDIRLNAARVLGRIGKKAESAVPELVNALQDKDSRVRYIATDTLVRIGYNFCRLSKLRLRRKIIIHRYRIDCIRDSQISIHQFASIHNAPSPRIGKTIVAYQNKKPLVICSIPVINNILWKCPKNSIDKKPNNQKPETDRGQQNAQPSKKDKR